MTVQQFFSCLMDICDWDKLGDDEAVIEPLVSYLSQQSDEEIFSFEDIMAELLYALDTKKNFMKARRVYDHSDDTFLYSRCAALTNGEEYYEKVKRGRMTRVWGMEFEAILSVPAMSWGRKHGKDPAGYPHLPPLSYETGSNESEWK